MADRQQQQPKGKNDEDVIVTFNGKDHTLKEWTEDQVAATEDDPSLNWREAFKDKVPSPEHDYEEQAPAALKYKKKKRRKPKSSGSFPFFPLLKHFWVPFLSAVIVGLGIGFTVLILFSDQEKDQYTNKPTTATPTETSKPSGKVQSAAELAIKVQVVQAGVYSDMSGAKKAMSDLQNQGVPASVVMDNEKYDVFIGLAVDESTRKQLANVLKGKGIDPPYGKVWEVTPNSAKMPDTEFQFLKTGKGLLLALIPLSSTVTTGGEPDAKAVSQVKKKLSDWSSNASLKNVDASLKEKLTQLHGMIVSALSLITNQDGNSMGDQQPLLDAISLYQSIMMSLKQ